MTALLTLGQTKALQETLKYECESCGSKGKFALQDKITCERTWHITKTGLADADEQQVDAASYRLMCLECDCFQDEIDYDLILDLADLT